MKLDQAVKQYANDIGLILHHYQNKDLAKLHQATHLIAYGDLTSSTNVYAHSVRKYAADRINSESYTADDLVMLSVNGNRFGRISFDNECYQVPVKLAIAAGASFITDNEFDTNRPYNVGEREAEAFLLSAGYTRSGNIWTKTENSEND